MPLGFYIHLNGGIRILALQNGAFKAGRICGGLNESEERDVKATSVALPTRLDVSMNSRVQHQVWSAGEVNALTDP